MRMRIHTVEKFNRYSKGKTAKGYSSLLSIKAKSSRNRKGEEFKWLEIKATSAHRAGTGERGGVPKIYADNLTLLLDPSDLEAILREALESQLVNVPGLELSLEAKSNLEAAIMELTGNGKDSNSGERNTKQ